MREIVWEKFEDWTKDENVAQEIKANYSGDPLGAVDRFIQDVRQGYFKERPNDKRPKV